MSKTLHYGPGMDDADHDGPYGEAATYERHGHVATITYNRPEALNAVNGALRRDLNAAWERFVADEEAWVGIVTGAGDKAFCAGADLRDGTGSTGDFPGTFWEMPTVNSSRCSSPPSPPSTATASATG